MAVPWGKTLSWVSRLGDLALDNLTRENKGRAGLADNQSTLPNSPLKDARRFWKCDHLCLKAADVDDDITRFRALMGRELTGKFQIYYQFADRSW